MPFMLHLGAGQIPIEPAWLNNDLKTTDFLGGGETVRAKDFMLMHAPSELFLSARDWKLTPDCDRSQRAVAIRGHQKSRRTDSSD